MRTLFAFFAFSIGCGLGCGPSESSEASAVPTDSLASTKLRGLLEIHDELEARVDQETVSKDDRIFAYEQAQREDDTTAAYAFARAAIAGRYAQMRGLSAVKVIKEVEQYARLSLQRDPNFRDGEAARLLGTLYILAESHVEHGDSEVGLEMLEELVRTYPKKAANQLRLAEGYLSLGDEESGLLPLCTASEHRSELRPVEQKLLDSLLQDADSNCEGAN